TKRKETKRSSGQWNTRYIFAFLPLASFLFTTPTPPIDTKLFLSHSPLLYSFFPILSAFESHKKKEKDMAMAMAAGYGQIPFDEEMQKSFRPPPPFHDGAGDGDHHILKPYKKSNRLVSLDAFRGLCVFLMIVVDYGGSVFPIIAHSPWNGLHLADFVMPFFLFVVGISIALVYKKAPNRPEATWKAVGRAAKLFLLGILLQGGFLHGLNSLTYGVDLERIRLLGILQVKCSVRGDVGPACNSAGMIDRFVLGINHLYAKPVYKNLKECNISSDKVVPESAPSWCHAPFDPEGLLSSLTAAVTCLIGLQYGHVLAHLQDHKGRLENWCGFSVAFLVLGLFLALLGRYIRLQMVDITIGVDGETCSEYFHNRIFQLGSHCDSRILLEISGE
ncbi:unnamed protein product, partial [Linum tenue]